MPTVVGGRNLMSLLLIQADGRWVSSWQVARFDIEKEASQSPAHLEAAVRWAQERMIADLGRQGYEFIGPEFTLKGPLGHMDFADDAEADPGPLERPDRLDIRANEVFEAAERARVARRYGTSVALVDFTLGAYFKRRLGRQFQTPRGTVWQ